MAEETTGEWVKRIRLSLGMSQEAFANTLGCHRMSVSHWERGVSRPHWIYAAFIESMGEPQEYPRDWQAVLRARNEDREEARKP